MLDRLGIDPLIASRRLDFERLDPYTGGMKICTKCKKNKPLTEFPRRRLAHGWGTRSRCDECNRTTAKEWYQEATFEVKRDRLEKTQIRRLRKVYELTEAEYLKLLESQGGLCAICGDGNRSLVVDHCHTTGKVRGLLCGNCNTALGLLAEDPNRFRMAIEYLD